MQGAVYGLSCNVGFTLPPDPSLGQARCTETFSGPEGPDQRSSREKRSDMIYLRLITVQLIAHIAHN